MIKRILSCFLVITSILTFINFDVMSIKAVEGNARTIKDVEKILKGIMSEDKYKLHRAPGYHERWSNIKLQLTDTGLHIWSEGSMTIRVNDVHNPGKTIPMTTADGIAGPVSLIKVNTVFEEILRKEIRNYSNKPSTIGKDIVAYKTSSIDKTFNNNAFSKIPDDELIQIQLYTNRSYANREGGVTYLYANLLEDNVIDSGSDQDNTKNRSKKTYYFTKQMLKQKTDLNFIYEGVLVDGKNPYAGVIEKWKEDGKVPDRSAEDHLESAFSEEVTEDKLTSENILSSWDKLYALKMEKNDFDKQTISNKDYLTYLTRRAGISVKLDGASNKVNVVSNNGFDYIYKHKKDYLKAKGGFPIVRSVTVESSVGQEVLLAENTGIQINSALSSTTTLVTDAPLNISGLQDSTILKLGFKFDSMRLSISSDGTHNFISSNTSDKYITYYIPLKALKAGVKLDYYPIGLLNRKNLKGNAQQSLKLLNFINKAYSNQRSIANKKRKKGFTLDDFFSKVSKTVDGLLFEYNVNSAVVGTDRLSRFKYKTYYYRRHGEKITSVSGTGVTANSEHKGGQRFIVKNDVNSILIEVSTDGEGVLYTIIITDLGALIGNYGEISKNIKVTDGKVHNKNYNTDVELSSLSDYMAYDTEEELIKINAGVEIVDLTDVDLAYGIQLGRTYMNTSDDNNMFTKLANKYENENKKLLVALIKVSFKTTEPSSSVIVELQPGFKTALKNKISSENTYDLLESKLRSRYFDNNQDARWHVNSLFDVSGSDFIVKSINFNVVYEGNKLVSRHTPLPVKSFKVIKNGKEESFRPPINIKKGKEPPTLEHKDRSSDVNINNTLKRSIDNLQNGSSLTLELDVYTGIRNSNVRGRLTVVDTKSTILRFTIRRDSSGNLTVEPSTELVGTKLSKYLKEAKISFLHDDGLINIVYERVETKSNILVIIPDANKVKSTPTVLSSKAKKGNVKVKYKNNDSKSIDEVLIKVILKNKEPIYFEIIGISSGKVLEKKDLEAINAFNESDGRIFKYIGKEGDQNRLSYFASSITQKGDKYVLKLRKSTSVGEVAFEEDKGMHFKEVALSKSKEVVLNRGMYYIILRRPEDTAVYRFFKFEGDLSGRNISNFTSTLSTFDSVVKPEKMGDLLGYTDSSKYDPEFIFKNVSSKKNKAVKFAIKVHDIRLNKSTSAKSIKELSKSLISNIRRPISSVRTYIVKSADGKDTIEKEVDPVPLFKFTPNKNELEMEEANKVFDMPVSKNSYNIIEIDVLKGATVKVNSKKRYGTVISGSLLGQQSYNVYYKVVKSGNKYIITNLGTATPEPLKKFKAAILFDEKLSDSFNVTDKGESGVEVKMPGKNQSTMVLNINNGAVSGRGYLIVYSMNTSSVVPPIGVDDKVTGTKIDLLAAENRVLRRSLLRYSDVGNISDEDVNTYFRGLGNKSKYIHVLDLNDYTTGKHRIEYNLDEAVIKTLNGVKTEKSNANQGKPRNGKADEKLSELIFIRYGLVGSERKVIYLDY